MLCSRMLYKDRIGFLSCQRYLMLKITQNILEAREKTTVAPVISLFRQLSISRIDHRHQSGNWTLNGSNPHNTQPWPSVLCFTFSPAHVVVVPWATSSVCLISSLYRSRPHSWSYSDRSVDGSICIPPHAQNTHTHSDSFQMCLIISWKLPRRCSALITEWGSLLAHQQRGTTV